MNEDDVKNDREIIEGKYTIREIKEDLERNNVERRRIEEELDWILEREETEEDFDSNQFLTHRKRISKNHIQLSQKTGGYSSNKTLDEPKCTRFCHQLLLRVL